MKKSTLVWIIVLAIIAIGWYYVANHTRFFSKDNIYYGYYDDVRGLQEAAPVYLKGVKVGAVDEIDLNIREKVRVVFTIDKTLKLPVGTKAVISNGDVSGSKVIRLEPGKMNNIISPGMVIATGFDSTMAESFHAKITPILHNGKVLLRSADTALNNFNLFVRQGWGNETRKSFASINKVLGKFSKASGKANQGIQHFQITLDNLDSQATEVAQNKNDINQSLAGAEKKTRQLTKDFTTADITELNDALNHFSSSIAKFNKNKWVSDTQTYQSFTKSIDSFNRSTKDYMKNPPVLINIGGKKKK